MNTQSQSADGVVYMVDDDADHLVAVSRLLRAAGFNVKTFPSGAAFLTDIPLNPSGCMVIDLHMPHMNGLVLQETLTARGFTLPIIFLSAQGSISTAVKAMQKGAQDFITKLAPQQILLESVRRALQLDQTNRDRLQHQGELRTVFASLTPRERDVLFHVLKGELNKQTAASLKMDERSVKRHRSNFMRKVGVRSVAELTQLVHQADVDHYGKPMS